MKKEKTQSQKNALILLEKIKKLFYLSETIETLKDLIKTKLRDERWNLSNEQIEKIFYSLSIKKSLTDKKSINYWAKEAFNKCWDRCEYMDCLNCKHFVNTESSQCGIRGICKKKPKTKKHPFYGKRPANKIGWPWNEITWCDKWQKRSIKKSNLRK